MGNREFVFVWGFIILLFTGCKARIEKIDNPHAIAELSSIEIGNLQQWLLIRGEDRSNPILLWLHGGPGSAQMPIHRAFTGPLEGEFVIIHWDQRGAGKSNHEGFREETMTLNRYIQDVRELTLKLKERFNREKIFLLGHSWGTQLGILTVQLCPDDYHAFISVAQVVHPQRSEEVSYDWLKEQVESNGSRREKKKLESLGPPPFEEHDRYVAFAKMKDSFGGGMDLGMGQLARISIGAEEYTTGDYIRWFRGANRGSGPMWDELRDFDLFRDVPALEIPVWFIVGKNDYNTPAVLVEEYVEFVDAPKGKKLIVMDGVAHTPFMGNPEPFISELSHIKQQVLNKRGG